MKAMVNQTRHWIISIAIAWALSAGGTVQAFQLQDLDANRVDLMDYVEPGRWTVIMFWQINCVPCEEQKPGLQVFHNKNFPDTAAVVGVAIDGYDMIDEIEKINTRHKPTYPNLVAFNDVYRRQIKEMAGVEFRATPLFVIFDDKAQHVTNVPSYLPLDQLSQFIASQK